MNDEGESISLIHVPYGVTDLVIHRKRLVTTYSPQ
jgi:hypothetical protein